MVMENSSKVESHKSTATMPMPIDNNSFCGAMNQFLEEQFTELLAEHDALQRSLSLCSDQLAKCHRDRCPPCVNAPSTSVLPNNDDAGRAEPSDVITSTPYDVAVAKIIQLSRRNRLLAADIDAERTQNRALRRRINDLEETIQQQNVEENDFASSHRYRTSSADSPRQLNVIHNPILVPRPYCKRFNSLDTGPRRNIKRDLENKVFGPKKICTDNRTSGQQQIYSDNRTSGQQQIYSDHRTFGQQQIYSDNRISGQEQFFSEDRARGQQRNDVQTNKRNDVQTNSIESRKDRFCCKIYMRNKHPETCLASSNDSILACSPKLRNRVMFFEHCNMGCQCPNYPNSSSSASVQRNKKKNKYSSSPINWHFNISDFALFVWNHLITLFIRFIGSLLSCINSHKRL